MTGITDYTLADIYDYIERVKKTLLFFIIVLVLILWYMLNFVFLLCSIKIENLF